MEGLTIFSATVVEWEKEFLELSVASYCSNGGTVVELRQDIGVMAIPHHIAPLMDTGDLGVDIIGVPDALGEAPYAGGTAAFLLWDWDGRLHLGRGDVQNRRAHMGQAITDVTDHPVPTPGQTIVAVADQVMHQDFWSAHHDDRPFPARSGESGPSSFVSLYAGHRPDAGAQRQRQAHGGQVWSKGRQRSEVTVGIQLRQNPRDTGFRGASAGARAATSL